MSRGTKKCSGGKCDHDGERTRTGIWRCDTIRNRWSTYNSNRDNSERSIIVCEGEHSGKRRPGEDQRLIEMATSSAKWEIYSCGSRKEALMAFDCLNEDGYSNLYAVIDLDEQRIDTLRSKKGRERVLFWPDSRDLECFLLRTEAWSRVYSETLPELIGCELFPKAEEVGNTLPEQFDKDETASAHAWRAHDGRNSRYSHIHYGRNECPDFLAQIYEEPQEFGMDIEDSYYFPKDIIDVLECILEGSFPVITDWGVMPRNERGMKMQGKRALSLLASRIYLETKDRMGGSGVDEYKVERLRKKLSIPRNGHCSRLRDLILSEVSGDEMRRAFPELAGQV